ncbi:MAG: SPFH domain-containing protein [Anaerolineales bacterium]|nr:SPFH domain-containing protein [Anaerolineales bacterium]
MTQTQSFSAGSSPQMPPPTPQRGRNMVFTLLLILLVIGYWVFARYLERIDLVGVPLATLWQIIIRFPLPDSFALVREMFSWRVLRHFIPVIIGWWLAYEAAASLVKALYALPDRPSAKRLLQQLVRGAAPGKPLAVPADGVAAMRDSFVLLRIGGPGKIAISRGNVAVTELNGRFHRVLPAGIHNLQRFEYLHDVLDLHPQEQAIERVPLVTRDGIELYLDMRLRFQIDTGGIPVTRERPFPYDELAVRLAAYAQTVYTDGIIYNWLTLPAKNGRRLLRQIVAGYPLDDILANNQAADPLLAIQTELARLTRAELRKMGLNLISMHIGNLTLPKDVTTQYVEFWKSQSEASIRLSRADGEAAALEELEIAHAEAEVTMIQAILEGVQRARFSANVAGIREVVALRMIEALEKMARQSQQASTVSPQLLSQLVALRRQLDTGVLSKDPQESEEP